MSLTKEEVLKVAKLSKLELNEEEIIRFQEDLNNIFNYIDELNEIDTGDILPMTQVTLQGIKLREDVVRESLTQDEAMLNSPLKSEGYLVVPKVVGGDN